MTEQERRNQTLMGALGEEGRAELGIVVNASEDELSAMHKEMGIGEPAMPFAREIPQEAFDDKNAINDNDIIVDVEADEKRAQQQQQPKKNRNRNRNKNKQKNTISQQPVRLEGQPAEPQNLGSLTNRPSLSNLVIDVNNIQFAEKSPIETADLLDFNMNGKPTFQVIASQSGYIAHMESIRLVDVNAITNSTGDAFASKQRLYKTVFSKINTMSLGKIDYKTWLQITSFFDMPTLLYGIYSQTFATDTPFEVNCRHCKQSTDIVVNNETLISYKDEEIYKNVDSILKSVTKVTDLEKISIVNQYNRIVLPESKVLIHIQTPSLWNHLELISSVDASQIEENEDILGTLLFIKNLYIVDLVALEKEGKVQYVEVTDRNQIVRIIENLELVDATYLGNSIADRTDKYAINYKIRNFKCGQCQKDIGEIPVKMDELLFTRILQMQ